MNIGGAGSYLLNYLHSYDHERFDVSVALPRGGMLIERVTQLGIHVHELDCLKAKSLDLPAINTLTRLIRECDPDIVHTHGALSGRIAAKRCGKRVLFTRHSAFSPNPVFSRQPGKAVYKYINENYANRIIAVNDVCCNDLMKCGVSRSRIDVILNGAPQLEKFSVQRRAELRRASGYDPDDFIAGIIARVEPYKGQMFVVEAASILRDTCIIGASTSETRMKDANTRNASIAITGVSQGIEYASRKVRKIKFIIAGTGGSYEEDVKKRVKDLGLGDIISFPGFVCDVGSLLNMLDVQINASYVEATSLSLLEGMSIGLPAIASNESGNPWIIQDGVNGLLFKSRDSASLAANIARMYDSPELVNSLSTGALETYSKYFTCDRFARDTEATYLKILEE